MPASEQQNSVGPRAAAISWDECFMRMAHVIAERSKDPSTQAGAVIVNDQHIVLGMGYNGFPRGAAPDAFSWAREGDFLDTKYPYVCHAEENAVYNSRGSVAGATLYCTLFPCHECAKAIIQTGVQTVVFESDKYHGEKEWEAARRLFAATGVTTRQYRCHEHQGAE